jgi:pimeloyl-ACP methyl ester carboxylesterase
MHPKRLHLPTVALSLLAAARAPAADPIDLNRVTPVPATEPIPVVDFFRPSLVQNPMINRAGTHFAAFFSSGLDREDLMIYDLDKATFERLSAAGDRDIYAYAWLDEEHLVCSLAREKRYQEGILGVDIQHLNQAHPILQVDSVELVGVLERDRLNPLIWLRSDAFHDGKDGGVVQVKSQLYKGDLIGSVAQAADFDRVREYNQDHVLNTFPVPGDDRVVRYLTDKDGELAFAITNREGVLTLHRFTAGHWETCPVDLDQIDVVDCGNKPGELVVRGPRGTGKPRPLQFMDAATGTLGEILLEQKDHDFAGWLYRHPVTHVILGAEHNTNGPQNTWFTDEHGALQKMLTQDEKLRGKAVQILGSDLAQRRFLVGAFSDQQPVTYYLLDAEKHSLGLIKNSRPWIDPARMLPMNIMRYKTRDGHLLDAYVTLPKGVSKQHPAPLVVLPHGTFGVRDSWGYNDEVQFLASRGYAVLQPNYRGDEGYGWEFTIEQEWDFRRMSDDITDATKALLTSGYVDPQRVAIMGTNDGAYLALSGAVFDPELYRCCVVDVGIFDWGHVIKEEKYFQYDSSFYATALRFLGDPQKVPEKFAAITPLRHVDRLKAATFVDYVKYDPLVLSEGHRLISELEKYNVPHETLLVGDEFRGRDHLTYKVELYSRIEEFLKKNLAP